MTAEEWVPPRHADVVVCERCGNLTNCWMLGEDYSCYQCLTPIERELEAQAQAALETAP